jgi:hypothetical protein
MISTDTTWQVVRVTTTTWAQTRVARSRSRNLAEALAALAEVFAWVAHLGRPGHSYHVWEATDG